MLMLNSRAIRQYLERKIGRRNEVTFQRVEGAHKGRVVLYTLSTCMWCRMAKNLLKDLGVGYEYVDVDQLQPEDKEAAKKEIRRWNPTAPIPPSSSTTPPSCAASTRPRSGRSWDERGREPRADGAAGQGGGAGRVPPQSRPRSSPSGSWTACSRTRPATATRPARAGWPRVSGRKTSTSSAPATTATPTSPSSAPATARCTSRGRSWKERGSSPASATGGPLEQSKPRPAAPRHERQAAPGIARVPRVALQGLRLSLRAGRAARVLPDLPRL